MIKYVKASTASEIISARTGIPLPELVDIMAEVPTEDVQPVIRCKDCDLRGREDCAMFYECECGEQHTWETDCDYCSYGERNEK